MSDGALTFENAVIRLGRAGDAFTFEAPALTLSPGELRVCVGPSGSGKTTLVRLGAGILVPDRGAVIALGTPLHTLDDHARRGWRAAHVGLVFQDFALLAHLSGLENILLPYLINVRSRIDRDTRNRARELAESLEIGHTLARQPARLSHGERQRLAICRALITSPGLLLLDEPTASLDERRSTLVLDRIDLERRERGAGVLITTHDRDTASRDAHPLDLRSAEMPA